MSFKIGPQNTKKECKPRLGSPQHNKQYFCIPVRYIYRPRCLSTTTTTTTPGPCRRCIQLFFFYNFDRFRILEYWMGFVKDYLSYRLSIKINQNSGLFKISIVISPDAHVFERLKVTLLYVPFLFSPSVFGGSTGVSGTVIVCARMQTNKTTLLWRLHGTSCYCVLVIKIPLKPFRKYVIEGVTTKH